MIAIVRPAPSRLNQTYIAFVTMIPANKVEIAKISQSQSLAARATFPKMIGQAPEWINPPESTSSALQKNAAAPKETNGCIDCGHNTYCGRSRCKVRIIRG